MTNRFTVALNILADVKIDEGADIRAIMNGLECQCLDSTGQARVIGVEILDRNLIIEKDDEPDAE